VFNHLGHQAGDFPVAEQVANPCLSLPMSPYLKKSEQNEVIDSILEIFE
jgi:UDP-2-acetamido-2-deoxy-ribo-hexuluronate aminotransferase